MIVFALLVLFVIAALGLSIFLLGLLQTSLVVVAFVLGSIAGVVLPLTLVLLGERSVARMLRASSAATLYRPTITFGDSTDLLLKRRTWNGELAREVVGDIVLENPSDAIHPWHGQPLALVDETFGVIFDQRHCAIGSRLRERIRDGRLFVGELRQWLHAQQRIGVPAYSEVPRQAVCVALEGARTLLWGYEKGDHPDYVGEIYKKSQAGRVEGSRARQMLLPFAGLLLTFGLMWAAATWGPSNSGGGGSIVIGASLWLLILSGRPYARKALGAVVALASGAVFVATTYGLYLLFGPLVAALMAVAFLIGTSLFPLGGFLLWWRFPASLAETVANYYLRFGLLPFDDPVFRLSTDGQDVVEGKGEVAGGDRYRLATRWVGFDLDPEKLEELFAGLTETPSQVEGRKPAAVPDGGTADAPPGYVASPSLEVEGVQGYVPEKPSEDVLYVRNDHALSPFQHATQGDRAYKAFEVAKEKYGAGWAALTDKWVYILTVVFALLGLLFGWLTFHL